MKNILRRSLIVFTPVLLAVALVAPASTAAATLPSLRLTWSLPGNHDVKLAVTGANSRAWRITSTGTGTLANYRIRITVNTGDVSFSGDVSYLHRSSTGAWVVTSRYNISPYLGNKTASIGGCETHLRLCWSTPNITLPHDGNGTLGVRLHSLTAYRAFSFNGSIRRAGSEAFIWGPWVSTSSVILRP